MEIAVLLLAAGSGRRFGGEIPKQYARLAGKPLLVQALEHLAAEPRIRWVQPVVAANDRYYERLVPQHGWPFALLPAVQGGAERADSMRNGLAALPEAVEWVAVHDAARACPSPALLSGVFDCAARHGAAVPALPVHDTIKRVDGAGRVLETPPRQALMAVQTPQVAKRSWFEQALATLGAQASHCSDDASMLEACGFAVYVSPGDTLNRKVTTREDLDWLALRLREG